MDELGQVIGRSLRRQAADAVVTADQLLGSVRTGVGRRRRRRRALGAAAALVSVVAVATVTAGVHGRSTALDVAVEQQPSVRPDPSAVQQGAGVIPWLDEPAVLPSPSPAPTTAAPRFRPCSAAQVTATAGRGGVAAGNVATEVDVRNTGVRPCSLAGNPTTLVG